MVVQTNEKEFKGKTLQEYLEWKYPTKEDKEGVREINVYKVNNNGRKTNEYIKTLEEGREVDLREFVNLTKLDLCVNGLTSIDFLKQLPHPEKITVLRLAVNNIARTNLEFLRPFVNIEDKLSLGNNDRRKIEDNNYNRFYGSLEPLRNMTKLKGLCIDGTDVEEGLEYLPISIGNSFDCSPKLPNQKVVNIQNELRPFNYDLQAWQLAHPEKMLISRPEYFTNPESKDKWINALKNKLEESKKELSETDREKIKRITRLETKIQELERAKSTISQQTQTEFSTQDKSTQTDLTSEQIKQWEQKDSKKTLYQNFIDKYGKK